MPVSLFIAAGSILALLAAWKWSAAWLAWRGDRAITCPENHRAAGVRLDAARAASAAFGVTPGLRLSACSRWPEKAGCGQECLQEIASAPADCLVRNIADRWYEGKSCISCGNPIGPIEWGANQPALLSADMSSMEWPQVPAERLVETLQSAVPICFSCHLARKLVREYPDLAIDRSRLRG